MLRQDELPDGEVPISYGTEVSAGSRRAVGNTATAFQPNVSCYATEEVSRRIASIDALAEQFLMLGPDAGDSMELRSYLLESILPTVVVALEKLLVEVERNSLAACPSPGSASGNLERSTSEAGLGEHAASVKGVRPKSPKRQSNFGCSSGTQQPDHRKVAFDPIIWLAQFLYRNNPRYANFIQSSGYSRCMRNVAVVLRDRFHVLQEDRITKLKEARAERDRERERKRLLKLMAQREKKKTIMELTGAVFKRLCQECNNGEPISLSYLLSVFQQVKSVPSVLVNANLSASINSLEESLLELSRPGAQVNDETMMDQISNIISCWTASDFESFFAEITQWMDVQVRRKEDMMLTDIIKTLCERDVSLDELVAQLESEPSIANLSKEAKAELRTLATFKIAEAKPEDISRAFRSLALRSVGSVSNLIRVLNNVEAISLTTASKQSRPVTTDTDGSYLSDDDLPGEEAVPDTGLVRKKKLQILFESLDEGKSGCILTRHLNHLIVQAAVVLNHDIGTSLVQTKFPIPILSLRTHSLMKDYFVDYFFRKFGCFKDSDFAAVLRSLQEVSLQAKPAIETSVVSAEEDVLRELERLEGVVNIDYQLICSKIIRPAIDLIAIHHKKFRVSVAVLDQLFMIISSSRAETVGEIVQGDVYSQVAASGQEQVGFFVESSTGHFDMLQDNITPSLDHPDDGSNAIGEVKVGHAAVIPIESSVGEILGALHVDLVQSLPMTKHMATTQELDMLTEQDLEKLRKIAKILATAISAVERISKTITIAESSTSFIREQASADTTFYIVEGDRVYEVTQQESKGEHSRVPYDNKYLRPARNSISILPRTGESEFIYSSALNASTSIRGRSTAVPVMDNGVVVAVMVVSSIKENAPMQQEDLEEVTKVAEVLGTALSNVRKQKPRKRELEAEQLDDDGELIFAKFMLDTIRNSISSLDASAIAELKSYKKPPPTIHKVLKCVCFLFGKTPKQVKLWSDTLKYVNMDLLKQMVAYDPTAVQKKSRFIRIRKVLKTIPHGDIKKRGSLPAQTVFAWLIVSLDLRDKAVQARSRAQVETPLTPEEIDDEIEEDDDRVDDDL